MAGYTRQSAASIINGENITAPPINAEFNTLQDAFNGTTGHAHDGTTGNGPKIDLATSVSGFLPAANGGLGGKNNYAATTDPAVGDDINDGYAVGSVWYNVPDDRYYVCVYNAAGAAVWLENRFINSSGDFAPHANNTKDLGHTLKRWKDLFLSGNADIDGSLNVATTTYLGGILTVNANAIFNVGTTTTISNIDVASGAIDNAAIGTTVAAAGTFTTLNANTSLTAATADINGGSIDGATVGANSHTTGKFTTLESTGLATLNSVNIDGGAIDGAVIGANSAVAGSFTTISSAGQATLASVDINGGTIDGATIGATSASTITGTTITGTSLVGPVTGNVTGNTAGTHTGPVTGAVTGNLTGNVTSSGTSTFNNVTIDGTLNMNAGTSATITNLSAPTNDNDAARKIDVDNAVANLVDSAPGTLDTLNELAAALGDDADFSTTITNSIATKLPLAGGTMTGAIAMSANKITGVGDPTAAQDVSSKAYTDQQDALQVTKSGDSMSGNLAMGSNNITGLATPTANDHAVNKSYADNILGSSTAAATSASNAATSESNAATSETNAANSATAAAGSATSAAASYDDFDDRYLGAKATAPTVDNDGDALIVGALYFNSTTAIMYVYGSGGWQAAGSSVNGTSDRVTYTATAGQTVFAATYDTGYVDVYLNGVKLVAGTDFTATNGTSITLATGAAVNDVVDIVAYGTFVLADHYTEAQSDARYVQVAGDTMTGNLDIQGTLTSDELTVGGDVEVSETIPQLRFMQTDRTDRNTQLRTNGDTFSIRTLNDEQTSASDRISINHATGDISFYDTSGNAKLTWDASAESLGIGIDSPDKLVHLKTSVNNTAVMRIESTAANSYPYLSLKNDAREYQLTAHGPLGDVFTIYDGTAGSHRFVIDSSGNVIVGDTSNNGRKFRVKGSGDLVELVSTNAGAGGAQLDLKHESASAANGDIVGIINFSGLDSSAINTQYASIQGVASDISAEKGELRLGVRESASTYNADAVVIDSSGHLLVGQSSTNTPGVGNTTNGHSLRSDGLFFSSAYQGRTGTFGRNGNDGPILGFYKDGSNVGNIGTSGTFYLASNAASGAGGIRFGNDTSTTLIMPSTNAGANKDGNVNLGYSTSRFKDLYLSGGVYLGGTGSANKLDDYEEGEWTPSIEASSSNPTVGYDAQRGTYTKVGRLVTIQFYMDTSSRSGGSGDLRVGGIPFSISSSNKALGASQGEYKGITMPSNANNIFIRVNPGATYLNLEFMDTRAGVSVAGRGNVPIGNVGADSRILATVTYITDS